MYVFFLWVEKMMPKTQWIHLPSHNPAFQAEKRLGGFNVQITFLFTQFRLRNVKLCRKRLAANRSIIEHRSVY